MRDVCSTADLPAYDQALERVLGRVAPLGAEPVPLGAALGCVLSEAVIADRDQPPFNRSAMDGYAVRSGEVQSGKWYDVVCEIAAGAAPRASADLASGVSAIATGAAVPDAYDAVIPVELSEQANGRVRFMADGIKPGSNIHPRGADAKAGQVLIEPGTVVGPQHVGIAASAGCVEPAVVRRPRVSLLTTGDEVKPPATPTDALTPQQIRNSNGPMLNALLNVLAVACMDHAHVTDDADATHSALSEVLDKSDVVLTVGGVSAGRRDHVPGALNELGYEFLVKGVAIQPGKPVLIAQATDGSGRLVVGLPGNPVSVLATAHLFAWPILRKLSGRDPSLPWRGVQLTDTVTPNPKREAFRSAQLIGEKARVIPWQGSGDLSHTTNADGLVRLPIRQGPIDTNQIVAFLPLIGREP